MKVKEKKWKDQKVEQKIIKEKGRRERRRKVTDTEGRIESKEGQINDGKGKEKSRKLNNWVSKKGSKWKRKKVRKRRERKQRSRRWRNLK